jgi:sugar transferase (PEP-CTERM system associated)
MQVFNRHVSARCLTAVACEMLLISAAMLLAAQARGALSSALSALWKVGLATAVCVACFYYHDLYDLTVVQSRVELVMRIVRAAGTAAIALGAVLMLVPAFEIGHGIFLMSLGLLLVVVPAWRLAFDGLARNSHLEERLLVVGTSPIAQLVAATVRGQHAFAYRIVGSVTDSGVPESIDPGVPVLGTIADVSRLVRDHRIDRVIVCLSDRRGRLPVQELLHAKLSGVGIEDAATTYERMTGKILADGLLPSWLIFSDGFRARRGTHAIKRVLDVVLATAGLVLAAPLMLVTAAAVWLDSPGPILYKQERVGWRGQPFVLYKFRSMRSDAEQGTPVWAASNDSRTTRVGRFIRITRLDELPQLVNVLRGDMSFVGPRPERPFFVDQLSSAIPLYAERHAVKPGVTGWAQVKYRYGSSVEDAMEKLRYDLYYIKHLSIAFDLTIVIDTVKVILSGKGAR